MLKIVFNPNISNQEIRDISNFLFNHSSSDFQCVDFPLPPQPDAQYFTSNGTAIGIEHTNIEIHPKPKAGDLMQATDKKETRITENLRRMIAAAKMPNLDIDLTYSYPNLSGKIDLNSEILEIFEVIENFAKSSDEEYLHLVRNYEALPQSLQRILIRRSNSLKKSRIVLVHSTSQNIEIMTGIESAIKRKANKKYQLDGLDELWLLLVIPDSKFSPIIDWPEHLTYSKSIFSSFDKIFLMDQIQPESVVEMGCLNC